MEQVTEQGTKRLGLVGLWRGLLVLTLTLLGGAVRAESDSAAWAFDLLARVEQQRPTRPLDFLPGVAKEQSVPAAATARIQESYGRLPMHFEPNLGQTAEEVKFVARGPGYTLFLTADEAVLALRQGQPRSDREYRRHPPQSPEPTLAQTEEATPSGAVVRMRLEGAARNAEPQLEGLEKLPGISNYFLGNDPTKWRTHVPHYQRVQYQDVYPGIDLVFYGNPRQLEYDFVLAPGADPSAIRLAFEGVEGMRVADNGDLILQVAGGELVQKAPKVYQETNGKRRELAGRYVLRAGEREQLTFAPTTETPEALVGFQVASYQPDRPLVIDPVLVYSTYLGGGWSDWSFDIAVDGSGNAYVGGYTLSADFPTRNALDPNYGGDENDSDAFVVKLSSDGQTMIYSTYLGGSRDEMGGGIAVDGSGNAYVTGTTDSIDFPMVRAKYQYPGGTFGYYHAFIIKLSSNGQTIFYSTYLGGSDEEGGSDIAVDGSGNAYVTGTTYSSDFPVVNAIYPNLSQGENAFVTKLSSDGQTVFYSTYLGGNRGDRGAGIAVDGSGNAYVAGLTASTNFPTVKAKYPSLRGNWDAFVCKLSNNGQTIVYSTYLGGSDDDDGRDIAVDGSGNAYVTGETSSTDFPTVNAKYLNLRGSSDAFIVKLSSDGQTVFYSTYLGGSTYGREGYDWANHIAVDGIGNAYVTGGTTSSNFPIINAIDSNLGGEQDAFIVKLSSDGQTVFYSTYLGGNRDDEGKGIAVDRYGSIYIGFLFYLWIIIYNYSNTFFQRWP